MRMDTVLHYARLRAPSFHEAVPEVEDLTQDTVLTRQPRGVCGLGVCTSATTLAARSLPVPGGQGGDNSHAKSPHHGRRPHWMGRRPEGADSQGTWSPALRTMHINHLGLMAFLLALKRFEPLVRGCHVLIRTDNTATIYYINKQGGLVSPTLDALARELTLWCYSRLESIRASHVAGRQNSGADLLSRGKYYYDDWSLHPGVVRQIFKRYGSPQVDLFASEENAKCARFFSMRGTAPLGLDAMAHDWPKGLLYAFPPLSLIYQVLDKVRLQGLSLLLVGPGWWTWRSEIASLLYDHPWRLPPVRNLVSQANGDILHPGPVGLDLWVWPLRGSAWLRQV